MQLDRAIYNYKSTPFNMIIMDFINPATILVFGLNIAEEYVVIILCMSSFRLHNRILKCCALVAATLVLPALAYADRDHDRASSRDSDEHRATADGPAIGIATSQLYLRQTQGGC